MKIANLEVYGIIYKITNKVNNRVYIGQTTKDFNKRYNRKGIGVERVYRKHKTLKDRGYKYNKHLLDSIEKYGLNNFDLKEIFDIAFSKEELDIKEKVWISYYDSYKNGYNNNLGGEGNCGYDGLKGANNPFSKSVIQLSTQGDFIKEWSYIKEASSALDISYSKISSVCNGNQKTAGGYCWVYKDIYYSKEYKFKLEPQGLSKSVIKLTLNGEVVEKYNSATEASLSLGKNRCTGITRCCRGERKSYMGFIWVYEEDYDINRMYKYNAKSNGKSKPILAFTKNMKLIGEYETIQDITDAFGYSRTSLQNHMYNRGSRITEHVFIFKENYLKENAS